MYFNFLYLKTENFDLMRENGLLKNMQELVPHFLQETKSLNIFFLKFLSFGP